MEKTRHVSAGTQVVVHSDVRGSHNALVHPRGSVGIVSRTPAGTESLYRIRFPDGFEIALPLEAFEILKEFKSRLGEAAPSALFNLEDHIVYRCIVGSRAYGLDTDASDTDRRGIYLAPPDMEWSLYGAPEQFEDNAEQIGYWELKKFLILALKANPNVLECLYSPLVEKTTPFGDELLSLRESFLSQLVFQTFNGYALSQFKKLEQDRRNQGEIRWKHAMHLLRLLLTGAAILRENRVPVRVESHRVRLLSVKRGEIPWREVELWRLDLHRDFETALTQTRLPVHPDYEKVNAFLLRVRRAQAIGPTR